MNPKLLRIDFSLNVNDTETNAQSSLPFQSYFKSSNLSN